LVSIDFSLSPEEQFKYLQSKGVQIDSREFARIAGEEHHRTFTIQGVKKAYILRAIRDKIAQSMRDDTPFEEAKREILSEVKEGDFIPESRLRFIFSQNMYQANGVVRCRKQMGSSLPFVQYIHSRSMGRAYKKNYRERHWKAHGLVFRKDDPWLRKNMPPNGFGCYCTTVGISSYRVKKENLTVQKSGDTEKIAENGFDYDMCADEMEHIGKVESVEEKRSERGDGISELALFENEYRRVKHFLEICRTNTKKDLQMNNETDYKNHCAEANRVFEGHKRKILASNNSHILKGTLSYIKFENKSDIMDFSVFACALASHYPEKSVKYEKFSVMPKESVGSMLMGVSKENRHFMIREDILKKINIALYKVKSKKKLEFQDMDMLLILWHELLHLEQVGAKKSGDIYEALGEVINELTARYTLEILLNDIGAIYGDESFEDIKERATGYSVDIKEFRKILALLKIDEKEFVGDGSFSKQLDWSNSKMAIFSRFKEFTQNKKNLLKALKLLNSFQSHKFE
jgi:hypothetical protein